MNIFKRKSGYKLNKKSLFDEIVNAKTSADMWMILNRIPNPDIILRAIGKDISVLRVIKSNYQVSANITSRKAGVLSQNWRLKKGECPDKKYEFFEKVFKNFKVQELIKQILDAPLFGYVPIEIYWENDGKNIIPFNTIAKPQEWFHFDTLGNFYFRSKDNINGIKISEDEYKFLIPRNNPDYLNPYGEALLAKCYWYTLFMKFGFEFWFKFVERYGMPFLVGKYDKSMDEPGRDNLFRGLLSMFQDAVGIIPNDGAIDIIENGGGASDNYDLFIKRCENNCSKIILGQTLTTDIGSTGSYAASNTHQEVRQDIVESDKKLVEETINSLILMINKINFNDDLIPEFELYREEGIDTSLVDRDAKVKSLGVRFSKDYICKTYGYSEKDIELVNTNDDTSSLFSEPEEYNPENLIEDLEEYLSSLSGNPVNESLKKIIEFYSDGLDAEATEDMLAEKFPELSIDELEKILTKIIFITSLLEVDKK